MLNPNAQQVTQGSAQNAAFPIPKTTSRTKGRSWMQPRQRGMIIRQILLQLFLLLMLAVVLFPVLWIVSMAVDPRGISRPTDLTLIPPNANLEAFVKVLSQPFTNVLPIYFGEMLMNSLFAALGTSLFAIVLGASAAYAFSRFKFIGRQAGMLGFIVLLMLPATGSLIPLYILFNSVQVNSTLAAAAPAFFGGGVVAAVVLIVYRLTRSFSHLNPERSINLTPRTVTAGVVVLTFIVIALTFAVTFERSPLYDTAIDQPLAAASKPFQDALTDYNRRVDSTQQRERTAQRTEASAAVAAGYVDELTAIQTQALDTQTDLTALFNDEINKRAGEDATDNMTLAALLAAQADLQANGRDAALAALANGLTSAQTNAADAQTKAASARKNADDAAAALITAQQTLKDAQANNEKVYSETINLRNSTIIDMWPYMLLASIAALIGAGIVWAGVYALRTVIEPRTLVDGMSWILALVLIIAVGMGGLQARLSPNTPPTQALRTTLLGLSLALASGTLPFSIWNLKGYFDTIPKDLEEAAAMDGAGLIGTFFRIMLPLSLPAFAITILFAFMSIWSEFILSWIFLTGYTENYTLAMALATLVNGGNQAPPDMQKFAAMSILFSLPILVLFFVFQRWIVSGLTIGAVK
jgi:ABC-type maltose transport system permease subunit